MTKSEMKAKLDNAIATDDKPVIMEILDPIIERLSNMIIAGTLTVNVKANLLNNGITDQACNMIVEMAVIRAENYMFSKAK